MPVGSSSAGTEGSSDALPQGISIGTHGEFPGIAEAMCYIPSKEKDAMTRKVLIRQGGLNSVLRSWTLGQIRDQAIRSRALEVLQVSAL